MVQLQSMAASGVRNPLCCWPLEDLSLVRLVELLWVNESDGSAICYFQKCLVSSFLHPLQQCGAEPFPLNVGITLKSRACLKVRLLSTWKPSLPQCAVLHGCKPNPFSIGSTWRRGCISNASSFSPILLSKSRLEKTSKIPESNPNPSPPHPLTTSLSATSPAAWHITGWTHLGLVSGRFPPQVGGELL